MSLKEVLRKEATGKLKINNGIIIGMVLFLLVMPLMVLAENQEDCNFWCKVTSLFTPRDNLAGSAACTGFWNCLLERENLAGEADG